jgi:hypothetical protein
MNNNDCNILKLKSKIEIIYKLGRSLEKFVKLISPFHNLHNTSNLIHDTETTNLAANHTLPCHAHILGTFLATCKLPRARTEGLITQVHPSFELLFDGSE